MFAFAEDTLHAAVIRGQIDKVKQLLSDEKIDVNQSLGPQGVTPLHIAAWSKNAESVRLLLNDPRIKPETPDQFGRSALHIALLTSRRHGRPRRELIKEFLRCEKVEQTLHLEEGPQAFEEDALSGESLTYGDLIHAQKLITDEKGVGPIKPKNLWWELFSLAREAKSENWMLYIMQNRIQPIALLEYAITMYDTALMHWVM